MQRRALALEKERQEVQEEGQGDPNPSRYQRDSGYNLYRTLFIRYWVHNLS